jgi:shikimate 5-dehydrogenase
MELHVPRYFVFLGVTTGESSINRIFPGWRDRLNLGSDLEILGIDLPVRAPARDYRDVVERLKCDRNQVGAIITTHKLDVYAAARDLFDEMDHFAELSEEVSCIAKRDGKLMGWATDPISAGRALDMMLGSGYFGRCGGDVLCLGAGGAARAITLHLLTRTRAEDRPRRITVTDRDVGRLESLRALHARLDCDVRVTYRKNARPLAHDELISELPAASLVINATGVGKDLPGSPVTSAVDFPDGSIAWDLNYRGELGFLRIARAQPETRQVRVEDGWNYFILGWAAVMEQVFDREIVPEEIEELANLAAFARPRTD